MSDISLVGQGTVGALNRIHTNGTAAVGEGRSARPGADARTADRVELSGDAQLLAKARQSAGVRLDRVASVQQAIADGTYETPELLDAAIERLLADLEP